MELGILENFRLLDSGWAGEIELEMRKRPSSVRIVCPFIKLQTALRFLKPVSPSTLEVITRFDLNGFSACVSDIDALERLLSAGAKVRGVRGLHSKMYLFGSSAVMVTSANLTEAAMFRNREFGFLAADAGIISLCEDYFNSLWHQTSKDVTLGDLDNWRETLSKARYLQKTSKEPLPDYGETIKSESPFLATQPATASEIPLQSFVKFFGRSADRSDLSVSISDEVQRSGSHWACTYPTGLRPRQVQDGAVMFMTRMVRDSDYRIYGRAIGHKHTPGDDDATAGDIEARPWKERWSHYVRVQRPIFIAGPLSAGVSMAEMMDDLGPAAFASTYRNLAAGQGNTNPRRAIMRKAAMELTPQAFAWISSRLDDAILRHGALDISGPEFDKPHP